MATWTAKSTDPYNVNNKNKYESSDGVTFSNLNNMYENLLYISDHTGLTLHSPTIAISEHILHVNSLEEGFGQIYKLVTVESGKTTLVSGPVDIDQLSFDMRALDLPHGKTHQIAAIVMGKGMRQSDISNRIQYVPMPRKGELIQLVDNPQGQGPTYRVLSTTGTTAKLMRMPTLTGTSRIQYNNPIKYNSYTLSVGEGTTTTQGTLYYQSATNISRLQDRCAEYSGVPSAYRAALLQDGTPNQMYMFASTPTANAFKFQYHGLTETTDQNRWAVYAGTENVSGLITSRYVRSVAIRDLIEYFGDYVSSEQLNEFFFDTRKSVNYTVWLSDSSTINTRAWFVNGLYGNLSTFEQTGLARFAPVFTINLAAIPWIYYKG